jgi:hypothetical protein
MIGTLVVRRVRRRHRKSDFDAITDTDFADAGG